MRSDGERHGVGVPRAGVRSSDFHPGLGGCWTVCWCGRIGVNLFGCEEMALVAKNPPANAGDAGSIPGLGRFPRGGHGNPLQYSCLENPVDRGAWQAIVHGLAKRLSTRTESKETGWGTLCGELQGEHGPA